MKGTTMLSVLLLSSEKLDSTVVDNIQVCSEVMISKIFSTKNQPIVNEDVVLIVDESLEDTNDVNPDAASNEDVTPAIELIITLPYTPKLDKEAKVRARQMVAALQIAVGEGYQIYVSVDLILNYADVDSSSKKIPNLEEDASFTDALQQMKELIVTQDDDEVTTDPAAQEAQQAPIDDKTPIDDKVLVAAS